MRRSLTFALISFFVILALPVHGQSLSEEKLAFYSIPSVFQVFTAVNGELEYSNFDVNMQTLEIYPRYEGVNSYIVFYIRRGIAQNITLSSIKKNLLEVGWGSDDIATALAFAKQPALVGIKKELFDSKSLLGSGTAFAVKESGYLVTNAHVVNIGDADTFKTALIRKLVYSLSPQIVSSNSLNFDQQSEMEYNLEAYLTQNSIVKKQEAKYYVMPPSFSTFSEQDIFDRTWTAELEKTGQAYPGKDVAILKLGQSPVPALSITGNLPQVGEKIFIIGFPAVANLNDQSKNEATFTSGIVSAIRKSDKGDFDVIQTDASIGAGSSGGPVINQQGQVIGIVTLGNFGGVFSGQAGNFNYFLPISLVANFLNDYGNLKDQKFEASRTYRLGIDSLLAGQCVAGKQKIATVQNTLQSNFINRIIENCYLSTKPETGVSYSLKYLIGALLGGIGIGVVLSWGTARCLRKWKNNIVSKI